MIEVNGWRILSTKIFNQLHRKLIMHVLNLSKEDPSNYKAHPKTKLLASIQHAINVNVPTNPNSKDFRLGNTLGKKYTHWRRVKKNMPPRYRLFFRFCSKSPGKEYNDKENWIIFAWFNDELTLRKAGSKTDVYKMFESLLEKRKIPDSTDLLLQEAHEVDSKHQR